MRTLLLVGWLMVPIGVGIWHYGPGQERVQLDVAAQLLSEAEHCSAEGDWVTAAAKYEEALQRLPSSMVAENRRVRLLRAQAQMHAKQLPTANAELETLVEELKNDPGADPKLLSAARGALANSQYYMTWLMRLEGQPAEIWEPEIEGARQNYRLLAEQASANGDATAQRRSQEDLESSIRLARMDLGELQGLPLPSQ
jgi:hypothetical protein